MTINFFIFFYQHSDLGNYSLRFLLFVNLNFCPIQYFFHPRLNKVSISCFLFHTLLWYLFIFLKWANSGLFYIDFCLFKQTLQFLQQINVEKCPSSIRRQDLNSQLSDNESAPLTTRPGLPPLEPLY